MNLYTSYRACCKDCTDRDAEDCFGCIVGTHHCDHPEKTCLAEDKEALKCSP